MSVSHSPDSWLRHDLVSIVNFEKDQKDAFTIGHPRNLETQVNSVKTIGKGRQEKRTGDLLQKFKISRKDKIKTTQGLIEGFGAVKEGSLDLGTFGKDRERVGHGIVAGQRGSHQFSNQSIRSPVGRLVCQNANVQQVSLLNPSSSKTCKFQSEYKSSSENQVERWRGFEQSHQSIIRGLKRGGAITFACLQWCPRKGRRGCEGNRCCLPSPDPLDDL